MIPVGELYDEIAATEGDLDVIDDVANYLDHEYAQRFGQGPLWMTGSAVNGSDPADYDMVMERDTRTRGFSDEEDYRVIAAMMRDLSEDEEFRGYDHGETVSQTDRRMNVSDQVDIENSVNVRPNPVHRFEVDIQGVPLDISFNPDSPDDYAVRIR